MVHSLHTHRYLSAKAERRSIHLHYSFVPIHWLLKVGYCKYMSISCSTFSDMLSVLCTAQFDEILPKRALNLPFFLDGAGKSSLQLSVSEA